MKKKKPILSSKMKDIINVLHKRGGAMSAYEISEHTGIAYATVKKYLAVLKKWEVVVEYGENYETKD